MSHHRNGHHGSQQQERRKLQRYLCNESFINCQVRLLLARCECESDESADRYGSPIAVTPTNFNHQGLGFFHHEPVDISRFADTDQRRQAPHALFDFDYRWAPDPEGVAVGLIEIRDLPAQFVYVTDSDVGTNYGLRFVPEMPDSPGDATATAAARLQSSLLVIEKALAQSSSLERYNLD
ncbi:hypothetical protein [Allohahella marinimesophila]|uniref:Uncharacterized protein n=1 Tax=Allohahella marinimesophila TaxID=1054972 RepID=A0ABP7Q0F1_9GAMM